MVLVDLVGQAEREVAELVVADDLADAELLDEQHHVVAVAHDEAVAELAVDDDAAVGAVAVAVHLAVRLTLVVGPPVVAEVVDREPDGVRNSVGAVRHALRQVHFLGLREGLELRAERGGDVVAGESRTDVVVVAGVHVTFGVVAAVLRTVLLRGSSRLRLGRLRDVGLRAGLLRVGLAVRGGARCRRRRRAGALRLGVVGSTGDGECREGRDEDGGLDNTRTHGLFPLALSRCLIPRYQKTTGWRFINLLYHNYYFCANTRSVRVQRTIHVSHLVL